MSCGARRTPPGVLTAAVAYCVCPITATQHCVQTQELLNTVETTDLVKAVVGSLLDCRESKICSERNDRVCACVRLCLIHCQHMHGRTAGPSEDKFKLIVFSPKNILCAVKLKELQIYIYIYKSYIYQPHSGLKLDTIIRCKQNF